MMKYIAKTFLGLEGVLSNELKNLGAKNIKIENRAVSFEGELDLLYKTNLWLRTATRVLKKIKIFNASDADTIYNEAKNIDWDKYFSVNQTFAINTTVYSDNFCNSQFVAYRTKDAIADFFSEKYNKRPSVRITKPDIMINVHISNNICTICLDSSGESLHKRGYRKDHVKAPINEVLAAGMILLSGWNAKSNFIDFMCGSGTILIEAAMIALNIPPGIYRDHFAFENWNDFNKELFEEIFNDDSKEKEFKYKIYGSDISKQAIEIAEKNIKYAGLSKNIQIDACSIANFKPPKNGGIIITNPPYGERLDDRDIFGLYSSLGNTIKHKCEKMEVWIISSNTDLLKSIGLKPSKKIELRNGDLRCEFWMFEIFAGKRKEFLSRNIDKNRTQFENK